MYRVLLRPNIFLGLLLRYIPVIICFYTRHVKSRNIISGLKTRLIRRKRFFFPSHRLKALSKGFFQRLGSYSLMCLYLMKYFVIVREIWYHCHFFFHIPRAFLKFLHLHCLIESGIFAELIACSHAIFPRLLRIPKS